MATKLKTSTLPPKAQSLATGAKPRLNKTAFDAKRFVSGLQVDGFKNFWGDIRSTLHHNSPLQDAESQETRRLIYQHIRHVTGLTFAGYGDEPEKWLAWLKEADDSGVSEAHRARAMAASTNGLPDWAIL